jgi:hypothetical protein
MLPSFRQQEQRGHAQANDVGVKTLLLKTGAEIQLLVDYRRETARLTGDMVAEHILDEAAHHRAHF